jgi:UDP-N-acetylglucosamine 2-epimerase (non-hydrolysing)
MSAMRVLGIVGTRPEAIKMAPLMRGFAEDGRFDLRTCVTAQHRDMLDQVLAAFDWVPDADLDVMKPNQSLSDITTRILSSVGEVIARFQPQLVLVHGDTTTTLASALAAYYQRVPVGHVEAGLRTGDIYSPWPEEGNRKLTTGITALHFAPTEESRNNLLREGVADASIFVTGNTVIDALLHVSSKLETDAALEASIRGSFDFLSEGRRMILVTCHRRESFGGGFERVAAALAALAARFPDVEIVFPVHKNPNVREPIYRLLSGVERVHLIEPVDYVPFVWLMKRAHLILTDSGGMQEEAPSLGKPVLVLRETTERPEAIAAGTVRLVGTDTARIVDETARLLTNAATYRRMSAASNPYGDGLACGRIIEAAASALGGARTLRPAAA